MGFASQCLAFDSFTSQSRTLVEASQVANWNLVLSARLTKPVASIKQVLGGLFFCWSLKFRWHISKGNRERMRYFSDFFLKYDLNLICTKIILLLAECAAWFVLI